MCGGGRAAGRGKDLGIETTRLLPFKATPCRMLHRLRDADTNRDSDRLEISDRGSGHPGDVVFFDHRGDSGMAMTLITVLQGTFSADTGPNRGGIGSPCHEPHSLPFPRPPILQRGDEGLMSGYRTLAVTADPQGRQDSTMMVVNQSNLCG